MQGLTGAAVEAGGAGAAGGGFGSALGEAAQAAQQGNFREAYQAMGGDGGGPQGGTGIQRGGGLINPGSNKRMAQQNMQASAMQPQQQMSPMQQGGDDFFNQFLQPPQW